MVAEASTVHDGHAVANLRGGASDVRSKLAWAKFWLVSTGVWWGICMQLLYYQGASNPMAMLPNLDWYVGMMLVYAGRLCASKEVTERYAGVQQRHVIPIAICDYLGTVGTTVGLELSGSAMFGIIFSSVTVWAALFTCIILHKAQSVIKMVGIAGVVAGLALPTLEARSDPTSSDDTLLGIVLTFGGTLFYALEYTLCERAFSLYDRPVDSKQLCFFTGVWGLVFTALWMALYTIPRWNELVVSDVAAAAGSPPLIALLYATHTINNGVHNAAWFVVCELESGVSTGLLMGVKAAALFVASALFFCDEQHTEQCMTTSKSAATCIVVLGTVIYYWPEDSNTLRCPDCAARSPSGLPCWCVKHRTAQGSTDAELSSAGDNDRNDGGGGSGGGGSDLSSLGSGNGKCGDGNDGAGAVEGSCTASKAGTRVAKLRDLRKPRRRQPGHARLPTTPEAETVTQASSFSMFRRNSRRPLIQADDADDPDDCEGDPDVREKQLDDLQNGTQACSDDDGSLDVDTNAAVAPHGTAARSGSSAESSAMRGPSCAYSSSPGTMRSPASGGRARPSLARTNVTPQPLSTPNDDCIRTPLKPDSSSSAGSADAVSAGSIIASRRLAAEDADVAQLLHSADEMGTWSPRGALRAAKLPPVNERVASHSPLPPGITRRGEPQLRDENDDA